MGNTLIELDARAGGEDLVDLENSENLENACPNFPVVKPDEGALSSKLNWLRAGVLGANDGIVSTAGIVVGVAGASLSDFALLASGIAGMLAGALSMAAGEYVSVSSQRDAERAALTEQRAYVEKDPRGAELRLAGLIAGQGISKNLALATARELSKDIESASNAHAQYEYGLAADELVNPWEAALASMGAFFIGALIPLFAMLLSPHTIAVPVTAIAVTTALAITGSVSAKLGNAPILRATIRNIIGGNAAMAVTYFIGVLVSNFA